MGAPHPLLLPLLAGEVPPAGFEISMDVVQSAEEHYVAALIDEAVRNRSLPTSEAAKARLAANTMAVEAENSANNAALTELLEIAEDIGVDLAVFKGAAIGLQLYADPRRRPAVDIDIFVAPDSLWKLGELVQALGGSASDADAVNAAVASDRVFEITVEVNGTPVDVHRDPMNMLVLPQDENKRWERTAMIELPIGSPVRTLDLEDTIIQALLHLFRDNFADLLHINDARLMIDAEPDWEEVQLRTDLNGWTALVRYALWFVSNQLGRSSPLPTTIERWQKRAIESIWPRDLLLKGSESQARSLRRQSAAGMLVSGRPGATARAYGQRLLPPRAVIDQRSGQTEGSYATALARWRLAQRRENTAFRDASYRDGQ